MKEKIRETTRWRRDVLLLIAFFSSGMAGLGFEFIWMRILGLAFGSETFGMLGVLAGFFAGLALGAAVLHPFILRGRRPILIYVAAECIVAAYGVAGAFFLLPLADTMPRLLGAVVGDNRSLAALTLNLIVAMVLLLPATFCMGASTASAIEGWRRLRTRAENETTVASLYAANTFGATAGIIVTTYLLMPWIGVRASSAALGGFSLLAAIFAVEWQRAQTHGSDVRESNETPEAARYSRLRIYLLLFVTGLAGIGLETVGTHVLAQILENTVHTFANILAIYLLGTAAGAWLYAAQPVRRWLGERDRATSLLLYGLAAAGIAAALTLAQAASVMAALSPPGSSYLRMLIAEAVLSGIVFLPLTVFMGACYSHLLGHFTYQGAGYASAVNTLGASLAPFVFGLLLIPSAGYGVGFYCATGMYLALFIATALWCSQSSRWVLAGMVFVALAGAIGYTPLVLIRFPPNARLLAQRIGIQGVVSVSETGSTRLLQVDQRFLMGGTPGLVTKRMGHLAMLLAPNARRVLYLGVGTGITASAALAYPVERVTGVELIPEILAMLPWFAESNGRLQDDPRVVLHVSDARRFVRATADTYDAIVADLYHPSRDGTGALYTVEHFAHIRGRLRPGGVFIQWLPLYQLRPHDLKTIVRTFLAVFPNTHSIIGNYSGSARFALLGLDSGYAGIDIPRSGALIANQKGPDRVIDGTPDLLASYMLDAEGLRRYAGDGPVNTDVNQRIAFDAAGGARVDDGAARDRSLASLLPYRRFFPGSLIHTAGPGGLAQLEESARPYAEAVAHYLNAELLRAQANGGEAGIVAEYLNAYRLDVRFTLAAGKLLELAIQQPGGAQEIVRQVWLAHPTQPDFNSLHRLVESIESPGEVRAIVSRFLRNGGEL